MLLITIRMLSCTKKILYDRVDMTFGTSHTISFNLYGQSYALFKIHASNYVFLFGKDMLQKCFLNCSTIILKSLYIKIELWGSFSRFVYQSNICIINQKCCIESRSYIHYIVNTFFLRQFNIIISMMRQKMNLRK